jgi:pimeloyl-ACP methyl ester carboxylesterase
VWEPVLDALAAQRDVIAIDLPGFGDEPVPPPPGTAPGVGSLTSIVSQFIFDELGLADVHVAGNSLGGWIALELAKQGRVRSATALSPAGFQRGWERTYSRVSLWTSVRAARLLAPVADRVAQSTYGRRVAFGLFVAHPDRLSAEVAVASSRALAQAPWFDETLTALMRDRFSGGDRTSVPVTIGWGEYDRLLLPRQAWRAARMIPGAQLVALPGCGHVPMYDDPALVARVLLDGSRAS